MKAWLQIPLRSEYHVRANADFKVNRRVPKGERELVEGLQDRLIIRELIENWVLWRDARMWDKFRTVWHDDGRMMATWTQGTAEEFIENSKKSFANGMRVMHLLGGSSIEVQGERAIAQTKMTILQRAPVHGILCDVTCIGRFYDFVEKREGHWA